MATTDCVLLRPFSAEHLTPRYVGWLNDPEVVRFSEQRHRSHTLQSCAAYVRALEQSGHLFLAIEAMTPPLGHIGNLTATIDRNNGIADIAIMIGERAAWGQGLGCAAWRAAIDILLTQNQMRKITGGTVETNTAMIAIMRRAGMVEDGRRCRHFIVDGASVDVVHYAIFADAAGQASAAGGLQ